MAIASPGQAVWLVDKSKRCEPSGFLLNRVVHFLRLNNYQVRLRPGDTDVIIVNSCCVTQDKIAEALAGLQRVRAARPGKPVVLLGCLAGFAHPAPPAELEGVIGIGPKEIDRFDELFAHHLSISAVTPHIIEPGLFADYQQRVGLSDYYILIALGCSFACSYCNIKRAKGEVKSTPIAEVVAQVQEGLAAGRREFTLLADDSGSYGHDLGTDLVGLLEALLDLAPRPTFKIGYLFPAALIKMYSALRPLFATRQITYLNVPLQSGSPRVLELMNRHYDVQRVLEIMDDLRRVSPGTWQYTHFLINFPSESDADFAMTLAAAPHFDELMFIGYSDNPGTPASRIEPKVSSSVQQQRVAEARGYLEGGHKGVLVFGGDAKRF